MRNPVGGDRMRLAGWLALGASLLTVGLVAYGAWVRASGSGLGCPDWPLCKGSVVPALEGDTAIEFGHRLFAGITMLVAAAAALLAWRSRAENRVAAWLIAGALGAILVQAALGGATVLTELHGMVRLAHLGVAFFTLALLVGGALVALRVPGSAHPGTRLSGLLLSGTVLVVLAGGFIVGSAVGAGCPGLPLCDGRSAGGTAILHDLHRVAALLLFLGFVYASYRVSRLGGTRLAKSLSHSAVLFTGLQGVVGIAAVVQTLPQGLRVLHLALAALVCWVVVAQWSLAMKARSR
jgi:heme A synthase